MKNIVSLPSFSPVAAGITATIDLPTTGVYDGLRVVYTTTTGGGANQANMEAEITEVRIKVNGKVQRRFSAAHLFALNAFRGVAFQTGQLPIYFYEPWRKTVQGQDALAWGMADVATFQVEIDVDAAALNPTLVATALKTDDGRVMGPIVKIRQHVIPVPATGIVNVTNLPRSDAYFGLHAVTADIDDVEIKIDQVERFKITEANMTALMNELGLVPQTGYFHIPFDFTNRTGDALSMKGPEGRAVSDFRIDFNMAVAASFTLLALQLGLRD